MPRPDWRFLIEMFGNPSRPLVLCKRSSWRPGLEKRGKAWMKLDKKIEMGKIFFEEQLFSLLSRKLFVSIRHLCGNLFGCDSFCVFGRSRVKSYFIWEMKRWSEMITVIIKHWISSASVNFILYHNKLVGRSIAISRICNKIERNPTSPLLRLPPHVIQPSENELVRCCS